MILRFNYEELTALKAGAEACLAEDGSGDGAVMAPPEDRARVEAFLPELDGDMSLSTLSDVREVLAAVEAIVDCLRVEMESTVVATHAADEGAVPVGGVGGPIDGGQGVVARGGEVGEGVGERAVQVEHDSVGFHGRQCRRLQGGV